MIMVQASWGDIYQCSNRAGATVYTDSPTQLHHCRVIKLEPSQPHNSVGIGQSPEYHSIGLVPHNQTQELALEVAAEDAFTDGPVPPPFEFMETGNIPPHPEKLLMDASPMAQSSLDGFLQNFEPPSDKNAHQLDPR